MQYLWENKGATNARVGPTYAGFEDYEQNRFEEAFTTMATVQPSDAGRMNPATQNGITAATTAALAPGPGTPLEKIKALYERTFTRAKDKSRSVRASDAEGGRLTSYQNIYGTPVVPVVETPVSTNANRTVQSPEARCPITVLREEVFTIARENQFVTVPENSLVMYGTGNRNVKKTMSGRFQASNAVFGDPVPGTVKFLFLRIKVLGEEYQANEICVPDNTLVYYGTATQYVSKRMSGYFRASNSIFGDPAPGSRKLVFIVQVQVNEEMAGEFSTLYGLPK